MNKLGSNFGGPYAERFPQPMIRQPERQQSGLCAPGQTGYKEIEKLYNGLPVERAEVQKRCSEKEQLDPNYRELAVNRFERKYRFFRTESDQLQKHFRTRQREKQESYLCTSAQTEHKNVEKLHKDLGEHQLLKNRCSTLQTEKDEPVTNYRELHMVYTRIQAEGSKLNEDDIPSSQGMVGCKC